MSVNVTVFLTGPYYRATRDAYFIVTYLRATHEPAIPAAAVPVRTDGKNAHYFHSKDAHLTERLAAKLYAVYASEQWKSVQTVDEEPGSGSRSGNSSKSGSAKRQRVTVAAPDTPGSATRTEAV